MDEPNLLNPKKYFVKDILQLICAGCHQLIKDNEDYFKREDLEDNEKQIYYMVYHAKKSCEEEIKSK